MHFNIQRFNNLTGELEPLQLRTIGYRFDRRTGNYILVYNDPTFNPISRFARQEIVVQSAFFMRVVPEIKADVIAGCIEVKPSQFKELGFVVHNTKEVDSHAITA